MDKKLLGLSFFLTSFTSKAAAASFSDIFGNAGVSENSILALYGELIGVQIGSPLQFFGTLGALAVLWGATYMAMKITAERLEITDTVMPGSGRHGGGGHNILMWMSLLVVISMAGTGYFALILRVWQTSVVLVTAVSILVLLVLVLVSGGRLSGAGLKWGKAKYNKANALADKENAEAKKMSADAENMEAEAQDLLGDAEEALNKAQNKRSAQNFEVAIKDLAQAEKYIDEAVNADTSALRNTLNEAEALAKQEGVDESLIRDIQKDLKTMDQMADKMRENLNTASNIGSAIGLMKSNNDFNNLHDAAQDYESNIQKMMSNQGKSGKNLRDVLQNLMKEAQEVAAAYKLIEELQQDIKQADSEDEYFEQYAQKVKDEQLHNAGATLNNLEQNLKTLHEDFSDLESALRDVLRFLQKDLDLNAEEIEQLRKEVQEEEKVRRHFGEVVKRVAGHTSPPSSSSIDLRAIVQDLSKVSQILDDSKDELVQIAERKQQEDQMAEQVEQQVQNALP